MTNEPAGEQTQTEEVTDEQVTEEQPEVSEEAEVETEEQAQPESPEELKKKIATLEAQKNHYRDKASKREALETSTSASMSPSDLVAVMNAGVHADDMERVERFAIAEGIPIREAVNNPELQAMLEVRNEQRNTAVATNVENVRRGNSKPTAEALINRVKKGDIPSSDDDIEALVSSYGKNRH